MNEIPIDNGDFVDFVGDAPAALIGGVLSMQDVVVNVDADRCGAANTFLYFVRKGEGTKIRLMQTTEADEQLQIRYRDVTIPGAGLGDAIPVNSTSPLPFTVDSNKIPDYDAINARVPADVFAYLPHHVSGDLPARPVFFYLNWFNSKARNNGIPNSPVGHEIVHGADGWSYLDVAGDYAAFITDVADNAKLPRRYLYLGTVGGLADGTVVCVDNKRLIWNNYNRIEYPTPPALGFTGFSNDPTVRWSPPGFSSPERSYPAFQRVNAAIWTEEADSPWSHYAVVGRGDIANLWPTFGAGIITIGNAQVKCSTFDGEGEREDLLEVDQNSAIILNTGLTDSDQTERTLVFERRAPIQANIGYRAYQFLESLGEGGADPAYLPYFAGGTLIVRRGEC